MAASRTTKKKTRKKAAKKTATKKATTKKAPAQKSPAKKKRAARKREEPKPLSKAERLTAIENLLNEPGKPKVIRRASESSSSYLLRRPTGITSLDIKLAGGFPASSPVMLTGPDGAGKDYLLLRTCAEVQRIYGDQFAMAIYLTEFRMDKPFARDVCGLKVAMTNDELDELDLARDNAGLEPLTQEERDRYQEQDGTVHIIEGVPAEYGFDAIIQCVASNAYQIIAVNSVGFMQTLAKEGTESYEEFPQQRNEAILLSKFMPDLALTMNKTNNFGERNESCVVLIDQVRSKDQAPRAMKGRKPQEKDKYRPARQVWAMKHGLSIVLEIHKGKRHYDDVEKCYLGREVKWEITKGKLGTHDGISGTYNFFYDGGADTVGDLITEAQRLEVFDVSGNWLYLDDPVTGISIKANGKAQARRAVMENPELRDRLRYLCFQAAGVVYRHR